MCWARVGLDLSLSSGSGAAELDSIPVGGLENVAYQRLLMDTRRILSFQRAFIIKIQEKFQM